MKTLIVYCCDSIDRYPNYMEDYMLELDDGGLLRVIKEIRAINYDSQEVAVYKNWDYYKIEDDNDF